jgi:Zn-dependent peptidase ImmA (M78 family)/DNA-binding XRE family transcriptional regulator
VTEAGFEPQRMTLARELQGWNQSQLAVELDLTAAAVSQFESGVTSPSPETQMRLAEKLNVPVTFFALPMVETHEGFFRSLRRTSVADRRKARALAHLAYDVAASGNDGQSRSFEPPDLIRPGLTATKSEIESLTESVRLQWGLPNGPVPSMIGLLESHGVIVIRSLLDTGDVDAFSLPFPDYPVVVLSSDKGDRARSRFDAAHELGHLVLHGEQFWGLKEVEDQANWFAAAFLMPRSLIIDELPATADWPALFALKQKWQVSVAALLMRARSLGKMPESSYLGAVKMMSARGWRKREPAPLGRPEEPNLLGEILAAEGSETVRNALPGELVRRLAGSATHS